MLTMEAIQTDRLTIRPFRMDDLDQIHHILDIDLKWEALSLPEREEWLRWAVLNEFQLARLYQPPYGDRAVTIRDTDTIIGSVGLVPSFGPFDQLAYFKERPKPHALNRPEIGLFWVLDPAYQGHGFATEAATALIEYAFGELHLKQIIATTEYTNQRSQAVMHRLGMAIEKNPFPDPPWFQVVGILENV